MDLAVSLRVIGQVISPVDDTVDENWGDVVSRVVLRPEYSEGLDGLEAFSHAIIVTYLHRAHFDQARHLKRRPRGLETMPLVGIFAQRAKDRPSPIGITGVEIVSVGTDYLEVRGLDAVNGTPVLDIKPYYPHYDKMENVNLPAWVERLMTGYF